MKDLIFNELSINFTYSNPPASEEDALEILRKFIENCLAYTFALGANVFVREYGNTSGESVNLFTAFLWQQDTIYNLLKKLKAQARLTDDEILRFKQMMAELVIIDIDPEYRYETNEVFGIGKAIEEGTYVVSLLTHKDWKLKQISKTQKITLIPEFSSSNCPDVNNISTPSHVFSDHEVCYSCEYKHLKPKENYLLPKYDQSKLILQAFGNDDWKDFYTNYRIRVIDRTQGLKIIKILAIVNGWEYIGKKPDNNWTLRDTYCAKGYYLQVDTEQPAFEVYNGADNHIGELRFDTNNLSKVDKSRFIRL